MRQKLSKQPINSPKILKNFRKSTEQLHDFFGVIYFSLETEQQWVGKMINAGATVPVVSAMHSTNYFFSGGNIHQFFSNNSSSEIENKLASIWLASVISLWESWLETIPTDILKSSLSQTEKEYIVKNSGQFFSKKQNGFLKFIDSVETSKTLSEVYNSKLTANKKYIELIEVEKRIAIYRYFKEIRNSSMHSNGRANQRLIKAQKKITALGASNSLEGVGKSPHKIHFYEIDQELRLKFSDVRALQSELYRLGYTIDSYILTSKKEEDRLRDLLKTYGKSYTLQIKPASPSAILKFRNFVGTHGLPRQLSLKDTEKFIDLIYPL